jgi:hypothetical protein
MTEWSASTPFDTFENPTTGSLIDIVSVVHVGLPSYYRAIGKHITSRQEEGFQVQHEGIGESEDFVPSGALAGVKNKLFQLSTDACIDTFVAVELGSAYENQDNSKLYGEEDDGRLDITEADYITGMSVLALAGRLFGSRWMNRKVQKAAEHTEPEKLDELVFGIIHKNVEAFEGGGKRNRSFGHKLVIDRRNELALAGVDATLEKDAATKLVLVWGIGHLAGLGSGLIDRGYAHVAHEEVQVAFSRKILGKELEAQEKAITKLQAKSTKSKKAIRT